MLITVNGTIYIACPANHVTGGSETLHQLAYKLKDKGFNVFIYYYGKKKNEDIKIPDKFEKYGVSYTTVINDSSENILILPETKTMLLYKYKNIQKVIWWLSVDFYEICFIKNRVKQKLQTFENNKIYLKPLLYIWYSTKTEIKRQLKFDKDPKLNSYFHLFNCQYCLDFLLKNGVKENKTSYLCGPISKEYFDNEIKLENKRNIVIYNPKKGKKFSEKVINYVNKEAPSIKFIALEQMDSAQIIDLFKTSKIYMDFGFFPGPERIPREAVLNYCNIITSNLGSSNNDVDVPIPTTNKFELSKDNIPIIGQYIISMINEYEGQIHQFDEYRKKVHEQVLLFDRNIDKIFLSNKI